MAPDRGNQGRFDYCDVSIIAFFTVHPLIVHGRLLISPQTIRVIGLLLRYLQEVLSSAPPSQLGAVICKLLGRADILGILSFKKCWAPTQFVFFRNRACKYYLHDNTGSIMKINQ